jgi:hypothetical protein
MFFLIIFQKSERHERFDPAIRTQGNRNTGQTFRIGRGAQKTNAVVGGTLRSRFPGALRGTILPFFVGKCTRRRGCVRDALGSDQGESFPHQKILNLKFKLLHNL